ncbi:MAG: hypothetical protein DCC52_01035 [Chloroflexi bacterium]|nr:MAG: hypothetical protein DCC52_01035 [Chloroflexota bacterium]
MQRRAIRRYGAAAHRVERARGDCRRGRRTRRAARRIFRRPRQIRFAARRNFTDAACAASQRKRVVGVSLNVERSTFNVQHCADVRIVLGAVAPTPWRAKRAEEILRGNELTAERIAEAARVAAAEAKPIDDVRSSAWYRREMVEVLTRRQLQRLAETA